MLDAERTLLIGRMLVKVLDQEDNLGALARAGSWRDLKTISVAKTPPGKVSSIS